MIFCLVIYSVWSDGAKELTGLHIAEFLVKGVT